MKQESTDYIPKLCRYFIGQPTFSNTNQHLYKSISRYLDQLVAGTKTVSSQDTSKHFLVLLSTPFYKCATVLAWYPSVPTFLLSLKKISFSWQHLIFYLKAYKNRNHFIIYVYIVPFIHGQDSQFAILADWWWYT